MADSGAHDARPDARADRTDTLSHGRADGFAHAGADHGRADGFSHAQPHAQPHGGFLCFPNFYYNFWLIY